LQDGRHVQWHVDHRRAIRVLHGCRSCVPELGARHLLDVPLDINDVRLLRDALFVHALQQ
jgi:hypothetical protein